MKSDHNFFIILLNIIKRIFSLDRSCFVLFFYYCHKRSFWKVMVFRSCLSSLSVCLSTENPHATTKHDDIGQSQATRKTPSVTVQPCSLGDPNRQPHVLNVFHLWKRAVSLRLKDLLVSKKGIAKFSLNMFLLCILSQKYKIY